MSKAQNQNVQNSANNLASTSAAQINPYIGSLTGQQSAIQTGQQLPSFSGAFDTYNNMAATGGFTPTQANQYMNQATSGVTNTYDVLNQQLQQNKAKTGGMGGSGETAQLARQLSQAQASAEQGAAVNLNQQVNANKLSGAQGLSGLYNTATGEITNLGQQVLSAMGINYANQAEALKALTALATSGSSSQGILGNIAQIGGMVGGGLMGAFGA